MRILCVRMHSIGDIVRVLSAVEALRACRPSYTIDYLVGTAALDVVTDHPAFDTVIEWDGARKPWYQPLKVAGFIRFLRARRYDVAIDFHAFDFLSGFFVGMSGAPRRLGYPRWRCRNLSYLFTNEKVDLPSPFMNRVDEFTRMVQVFAPEALPTRPTIVVPPEHSQWRDAFFESSFCLGKPVVIMHPVVDVPGKQWPFERFAELADRLVQGRDINLVVTTGPGQGERVMAVLNRMQTKPILVPEFNSLKALAAFVERADLFICNDTGPMHIASAAGVPVVAVFRQSFVFGHAPYWGQNRVLHQQFLRGQETPQRSDRRLSGIDRVSVDQAYAACCDLLNRETAGAKSSTAGDTRGAASGTT